MYEKINFINHKKNGEYKEYYYNDTLSPTDCIGQLRLICNYIDDKKNGEYKSYYMNGNIKEICNYVNGIKQSLFILN